MSTLPAFSLVRPTTLDDALAAIGDDAMPYAGGTEALGGDAGRPAPPAGARRPQAPARARTGRSGRRHVAHRRDRDARGRRPARRGQPTAQPMLASVLRRVGNARVRAQGTLGGNVCFAEPRSDVATALVALGASIVLQSTRGERSLPVEEFVLGPFTTDREPDELLVRIESRCPARTVRLRQVPGRRATDGRGRRGRADETVGGPAGEWSSARCRTARSYSMRTMPARSTPRPSPPSVEPIPDLTGSEEYKRHLTAVYVRRALASLDGAA